YLVGRDLFEAAVDDGHHGTLGESVQRRPAADAILSRASTAADAGIGEQERPVLQTGHGRGVAEKPPEPAAAPGFIQRAVRAYDKGRGDRVQQIPGTHLTDKGIAAGPLPQGSGGLQLILGTVARDTNLGDRNGILLL